MLALAKPAFVTTVDENQLQDSHLPHRVSIPSKGASSLKAQMRFSVHRFAIYNVPSAAEL